MLREFFARGPRVAAVALGSLSTMLKVGVIAASATPIVDLSAGATQEPAGSSESLPREQSTGPLCIPKGNRFARRFSRFAYSFRIGRGDADECPVTKPHSRFAGRIARVATKDSEPAKHAQSSAATLPDPFNAAAIVAAEAPRPAEAESIDDYLFEAYRRLPQKRDASGDFTWKDVAAATRMGLSLEAYVIGGIDPDFKELIYAAGKHMDAAGIQWSILAAFRDDWRQQIASGFKASAKNSCHGGSRAVGGYGNGHCVDLWTAAGPVEALFAWIDHAGPAMGLARPLPNRDPAHVQPVGDWRAIAGRLRAARLKGPMIATVRVLGGADAIADLTELATGGRTKPPIGLASITPANQGLPPRVHALPRPGVLVLTASGSPATVGLHKARRRPATASAAPRQRSSEQGRARLSAGIRVSNRT